MFTLRTSRSETTCDGASRRDFLMAGALGLGGLMLPDLFIPGLVSFLCAHLCYLALFKQGQRWFPSGTALACTASPATVCAFCARISSTSG